MWLCVWITAGRIQCATSFNSGDGLWRYSWSGRTFLLIFCHFRMVEESYFALTWLWLSSFLLSKWIICFHRIESFLFASSSCSFMIFVSSSEQEAKFQIQTISLWSVQMWPCYVISCCCTQFAIIALVLRIYHQCSMFSRQLWVNRRHCLRHQQLCDPQVFYSFSYLNVFIEFIFMFFSEI